MRALLTRAGDDYGTRSPRDRHGVVRASRIDHDDLERHRLRAH